MKDFKEQITRNFTAYPVSEEQAAAMVKVREACQELALEIDELAPNGREKSLALTNLEQVMFWADAAIARPQ